MRIEQVRLKNFKMFQDVTVKGLQPFTVLVGANGSGKTVFFDVFSFLQDSLRDNVSTALEKRGGFGEVVSRGRAQDAIRIELTLTESRKIEDVEKSRLVSYLLEIGRQGRESHIVKERLRYHPFHGGSMVSALSFSKGSGEATRDADNGLGEVAGGKSEKHELGSPATLALKAFGQFKEFDAANSLRAAIEHWRISDFYVAAAQSSREGGVAEQLSVNGVNLALATKSLFENQRESFEAVVDVMKRRVPGLEDIRAIQTEDGRIVLRFKDASFKDPFAARFVSDGAVKMFAYLVLLHDPRPHPLLCIEEPENQLYPSLMEELAEEFQAYARRGGQVFVSTHSPDFLNAVDPKSLLVLTKRDGATEIKSAQDYPQISDFFDAGDKLGWLWRQGLFQGANPQ